MDILKTLGYERVKEVTVDQFAKAKEVFNNLKKFMNKAEFSELSKSCSAI